MVIYAIVSLIVGVGYLFGPNLLLTQFGYTMNAIGIYQARILGAAMLGLAILTWSTRNIGACEVRNSILLSLFVFEGLGFVLSLIA